MFHHFHGGGHPVVQGSIDAQQLADMIETTLGCPFSCAFCADGSAYLDELVRFIICKKESGHETAKTIEKSFKYDLVMVKDRRYFIDNRSIIPTNCGSTIRFFHTPAQQHQIQNAISLYRDTKEGVARMIQRHNLKVMYRQFERVS